MNSNPMRWPGADGSAGLDFSGGKRTSAEQGSAASAGEPDATTSAPERAVDPVGSPSSVSTPPSAPSAAEAAAPTSGGSPGGGAPADSSPWSHRPLNQPTPGPAADDTHVISPVSAPESPVSPQEAARANAFSNQTTPAWQDTTNRLDEPIETMVRPALSTSAVAGTVAAKGGPSAVAVTDPGTVATAAGAAGAPPRTKAPGLRRTRKARLRLARLDPWSVMKTAFLFSIAFGVMIVVIVTVLWTVLLGSGALESVDQFLIPLLSDGENVVFSLEDYLNTSRVVGFSALIAAIDVVIITAVATLVAFLYNMSATLMGGLEVTLAED